MMRLEFFDLKHAEHLLSWIRTPEELMQFAGPQYTFPLTKAQLETTIADPQKTAFSLISNEEVMIGYGVLTVLTETFKIGSIIINPHQRGNGYGRILTELLITYGFQHYDQEIAELNVFDWNKSALTVYEKIGFCKHPEKKFTRYINGQEWTAINMLISKESFQSKNSRN